MYIYIYKIHLHVHLHLHIHMGRQRTFIFNVCFYHTRMIRRMLYPSAADMNGSQTHHAINDPRIKPLTISPARVSIHIRICLHKYVDIPCTISSQVYTVDIQVFIYVYTSELILRCIFYPQHWGLCLPRLDSDGDDLLSPRDCLKVPELLEHLLQQKNVSLLWISVFFCQWTSSSEQGKGHIFRTYAEESLQQNANPEGFQRRCDAGAGTGRQRGTSRETQRLLARAR